ncbi:hypothetical protein [Spirillospora sp. NPDC047279]|uniref:DUF6891 domain-containing protein n=1 Tax=Spirillospora sp. NPDC047279 TaxID=3155478 RepID=UPI0033E3AD88
MITELHDFVRFRLALGRDSHRGILNQCERHEGDSDSDSDSDDVAATVTKEFESYMEDQSTWPDVLDSDRFLRAFGDLNATGIVALADFSCCLSCGTSEIGEVVPDGRERRGYVFAHRQDMENAVAGAGCDLAFGSFGDGESAAGIGEAVVAALRGHGFDPGWSGDPAERVHVPLTWRRIRATSPVSSAAPKAAFRSYGLRTESSSSTPRTPSGAPSVAATSPWPRPRG